MESLSDAAARLLAGLERRRNKEAAIEGAAEIRRAGLSEVFRCVDDALAIPQTSPDTDERVAPQYRAGLPALRGLNTASNCRQRVYVTWNGQAVFGANDDHAAAPRWTEYRPRPFV